MDKQRFSIAGSTQEDDIVIGYSDGSTWNGWQCVKLEKRELIRWLDTTGAGYFVDSNGVVVALGNVGDTFHPSIIDGRQLYDMTGYCFVKAE